MKRFEVYYKDNLTGRENSIEFMATSISDAIVQFYNFTGVSSVTYKKVVQIYGY